MCLVFVAFATWAVRTSDLHTPDAWKTGLGALGEERAGTQEDQWCPVSPAGPAGMRGAWGSKDFSRDLAPLIADPLLALLASPCPLRTRPCG